MTDVPDLLIQNCVTAVTVLTGRLPSPYFFEKWEYEPGDAGVCRAVIRVADNDVFHIGAERSKIAHSTFFERKRFEPFCDEVVVRMAKSGHEVESISQVWLADQRSGGWGILFRVHRPD